MKKARRFLIPLLALLLGLFLARELWIIRTPYTYPIVPGTEAWAQLESRPEMVEACQIPPRILKRLSTKALMDTILSYPLLSEMLMFYRTPEQQEAELGFRRMADSFNGLQELLTRPDALRVLESYGPVGSLESSGSAFTIIHRNVWMARHQA